MLAEFRKSQFAIFVRPDPWLFCTDRTKICILEGSICKIPIMDLFLVMYVRKEALLSSQMESTPCNPDDILDLLRDENSKLYLCHRMIGSHLLCNRLIIKETLDSLFLTSLIHYRFETIHLFLNENRRIERLLIILFLMKKGALVLTCPIYFLKMN